MHEAGINGKLWRQLQNMHKGLTRRVRHPVGLTDPFDVERGVAQGAVESPWVYFIFIDGLAKALKKAGHGTMVAGCHCSCTPMTWSCSLRRRANSKQ